MAHIKSLVLQIPRQKLSRDTTRSAWTVSSDPGTDSISTVELTERGPWLVQVLGRETYLKNSRGQTRSLLSLGSYRPHRGVEVCESAGDWCVCVCVCLTEEGAAEGVCVSEWVLRGFSLRTLPPQRFHRGLWPPVTAEASLQTAAPQEDRTPSSSGGPPAQPQPLHTVCTGVNGNNYWSSARFQCDFHLLWEWCGHIHLPSLSLPRCTTRKFSDTSHFSSSALIQLWSVILL